MKNYKLSVPAPFTEALNLYLCQFSELPESTSLTREEAALMESFPSKRRKSSFSAGRRLIRSVFPEIGSILPDSDGRPQLPLPLKTGSLSHSGEFIAFAEAAAAPVGIDIQLAQKLSKKLQERVACSSFEATLDPLELFSAKEAAYKALSPVHRIVFTPSRVEFEPQGSFLKVIRIGEELPNKQTGVIVFRKEKLVIAVASSISKD